MRTRRPSMTGVWPYACNHIWLTTLLILIMAEPVFLSPMVTRRCINGWMPLPTQPFPPAPLADQVLNHCRLLFLARICLIFSPGHQRSGEAVHGLSSFGLALRTVFSAIAQVPPAIDTDNLVNGFQNWNWRRFCCSLITPENR